MSQIPVMKRPRLKSVAPLDGYRLSLVFQNDVCFVVDLSEDVQSLSGLKPLKDMELFNTATLIEGEGWTVEWPKADIQIGADTLWLDALAQSAPDENSRTFVRWRQKYQLSRVEAAHALGITPRTVSAYTNFERPVPQYIALACKGWEYEHQK